MVATVAAEDGEAGGDNEVEVPNEVFDVGTGGAPSSSGGGGGRCCRQRG